MKKERLTRLDRVEEVGSLGRIPDVGIDQERVNFGMHVLPVLENDRVDVRRGTQVVGKRMKRERERERG